MPGAYSIRDLEEDMRAYVRLTLADRQVIARAADWARAYWQGRSTDGLSWPFDDFDIPPPAEPQRRSRGRPPNVHVEAVYNIARQVWMYELGGSWSGWWRYRAAGPVWAREDPSQKHLPLKPANAPAVFLVVFAKLAAPEIKEESLRAVHERVWRSLRSREDVARRLAHRRAKNQEPEVKRKRLDEQRERRADKKKANLEARDRRRAALAQRFGRSARPRLNVKG